MKLADLQPRFVGAGGPGVTKGGEEVPQRLGVGISFNCPCGCDTRAFVYFKNPLDGGEQSDGTAPAWDRTGETFDNLTLRPSILRGDGCGWHGHLTDGVFKSV